MKIIHRQTLHVGNKFDLASHTLRSRTGQEICREFLVHPGSVVILPVISEHQIVLIRVYRHAIDQPLLELPAGTAQAGELPQVTAARELAEETGYHAGRLEKLLRFYPAPGASGEQMHLFLARDLTPGRQKLEPDEEIELSIVSLAEALAMTRDGRIVDAKTMLGLWHFAYLAQTGVSPAIHGGQQ